MKKDNIPNIPPILLNSIHKSNDSHAIETPKNTDRISSVSDEFLSGTFSIKNENLVHDLPKDDKLEAITHFNCNNNTNNKSLQHNNNYNLKLYSLMFSMTNQKKESELNNNNTLNIGDDVIVFNIGHNYLIETSIVYITNEEPKLIKLKYKHNNETVVLRMNDIYIRKNDGIITGYLHEKQIINELTILKNFLQRNENNKPFCYYNNKTLFLIGPNNDNKEKNFFMYQFIHPNNNKSNIILYRNIFKTKTQLEIDAFQTHILLTQYSNIKKYSQIRQSITYMFDILELFNFQYVLYYKGNEINCVFNPNSKFLFSSNALFNNHNQPSSTKVIINKHIINLLFNTLFREKNYLIDIWNIISTRNEIVILINKVFYLLCLYNSSQHICEFVEVLILSFIFTFHRDINKHFTSVEPKHKLLPKLKSFSLFLKEDTMLFISNYLLMCIVHYIFQFIKIESNALLNTKGYYFINSIEDLKEESVLTDILLKNNQIPSSHKGIIFYYKESLQNNLFTLQKQLTENEIAFLDFIYHLFNMNYLDINNNNILFNSAVTINKQLDIINKINFFLGNAITKLEHLNQGINNNSLNIIVSFNYNAESFYAFLKKQNDINYMFQSINLLNVFYKKNLMNSSYRYFISYQLDTFINYFNPILLNDTDESDNNNNNEDNEIKIKKFLTKLQSYQKINEGFSITKEHVYINYQIYETLMLLLKNAYDEVSSLITRNYLINKPSLFYTNYFQQLVHNVHIIQRSYRLHRCEVYRKKSTEELNRLIINKYKSSDQTLVRLILTSNKLIRQLKQENSELKLKINSSNHKKKMHKTFKLGNFNKGSQLKTNNNIMNNAKQLNSYRNGNHPYFESVHSNTQKEINITKVNNTNNNNNNNNTNSNNSEEIKSLKIKVENARSQYKGLVQVIVQYEQKMKNFVKAINANHEVKEVFIKNGIQIN